MLSGENDIRSSQREKILNPQIEYSANDFVISLYDGWKDNTIYTLTGPVTDGIQHNIIITHDKDIETDSVEEYAEWQIGALEAELKGCMLLKKGSTILTNGLPAYEAIFRWYPTDDLRIYQHQIFVLHDEIGYKLTASFTKKTRKTLGPEVERMMLSFNPKNYSIDNKV